MNSAEKQAVLHCLKSMIDEEVCEECPLYGTTGTDHCEKDCVRLAINALEQEHKMGHWEWVQYDSNPNIGNWHCSECRTIIPHMPEETDNTPIYKWCPMCGCKMQEVE